MAPEINADLVLSIWEKAGYTPQFSIEGTHDDSGFELFINGKTLHSYSRAISPDWVQQPSLDGPTVSLYGSAMVIPALCLATSPTPTAPF